MRKPAKLKQGDEIRVVAPSRSIKILSEEGIQSAKKRLEQLGFYVTFGKHVEVCDMQNSSSIEQRIEDLHDAFADSNVKGILTVIGGFNSNELLPFLDYDLLKANPKVLCGFSDITHWRLRSRPNAGSLPIPDRIFPVFRWMACKTIKRLILKSA